MVTKGYFSTILVNTKLTFYSDKKNGWSKVKYNGITGYIKNTCLDKSGLSKYRSGTVTVQAALRKKNSIKSDKMDTVKKGTIVSVVSTAKYWANCKVNGKDGFISMKKLKI